MIRHSSMTMPDEHSGDGAAHSGGMSKAILIRARYGFATPDAIHLGAALASGCDVFPTNDIRLTRFQDMHVDLIGANL